MATGPDAGPIANGAQSFLVKPGPGLIGELRVPGDKSITHRAIILSGLAEGVSTVSGFLASADCMATLRCMRQLGVVAERSGNLLRMTGVGAHGLRPPAQALDCGNSGTAMRLLAGVLAGQSFESELVGDASLHRRPMQRIADPLERMGASVATTDGKPPLHIRGGGLCGIDYHLPVPSAQVKSAILLAGLFADGWTRISGSGGSRDHTERLLPAYGASLRRDGDSLLLEPAGVLQAVDVAVPGDISSAAFFIVAAALLPGSELTVREVGVNPTRTGLLEALRLMGASIEVLNQRQVGDEPVADLRILGARLNGIEVPASLAPAMIDEYPVLFVAAAGAMGDTVVRGVEELRTKESDRIATMAKGLRSLGADVEVFADGLRIAGGRQLHGGRVNSHGDHRIAMAFAVAAHLAEGPVQIDDIENIDTSFPGFALAARSLGMRIEEVPAT